jgi:putative phosphoserine phosphatase / 1-acylglycerol-3-phosphate O-acyltransferase
MARAAAIFDLDRTLLPGASGRVLAEELRAHGVIDRDAHALESAIFAVFERFGETLPSMLLTRQGVRFTEGWDLGAVRAAGSAAAKRLVDLVQPYAWQLIDDHRRDGRLLVMATTSPEDLASPLCLALGFDAVIATRYGERDGAYSGRVEGRFVWGTAKRDAVRSWAAANDVDLRASYAYSDSFYDLPLLHAVGHPVAVNPDPRLEVVARCLRWRVRNLDVPEGVPKVVGVEPHRALSAVVRPELLRFARFDIGATEHIPRTGAAIVAANHRSYFDPLAIAVALAKQGRVGRFLAKQQIFDVPVFGPMARAMGAIPVDRGSGSDTPLVAAARALDAGEIVVILPQGTIPRGEAFFAPKLVGRRGVAVLARMSGAPVIPLGLWGTESVWPRRARVPAVWNVIDPPTVRMRVGKPIRLRNANDDAAVRSVMRAIEKLLPVVAGGPSPTPADIARTYPRGSTSVAR